MGCGGSRAVITPVHVPASDISSASDGIDHAGKESAKENSGTAAVTGEDSTPPEVQLQDSNTVIVQNSQTDILSPDRSPSKVIGVINASTVDTSCQDDQEKPELQTQEHTISTISASIPETIEEKGKEDNTVTERASSRSSQVTKNTDDDHERAVHEVITDTVVSIVAAPQQLITEVIESASNLVREAVEQGSSEPEDQNARPDDTQADTAEHPVADTADGETEEVLKQEDETASDSATQMEPIGEIAQSETVIETVEETPQDAQESTFDGSQN